MALVLSLKLDEIFMVSGRRVTVTAIEHENLLTLTRYDGKEFVITDMESTEIMPDVFVSSADFYKWGQVRIAIEAPRSIEIMREDRWVAKYGGEHVGT